MQRAVALTIFLASLPASNGQWQGFLQRRDDDNVVSSSYVKSFSWFQGEDGKMHQQTRETRKEVVQDSFQTTQTRTKVVCKDGRCQEETLVAEQPMAQRLPMFNQPMLQHSRLPLRLRSILDRLMGSVQRQNQQAELVLGRQQEPMIVIEPMQRQPDITMELAMPPQTVIMEIPSFEDGVGASRVAPHGPVLSNIPQKSETKQMGKLQAIALDAGIAAVSVTLLSILLMLKCRRSDAREVGSERPLRDLAEPLAPAAMEVAAAAQPQERKLPLVPMYLSRVYARAEAQSEKRSVREYVASLYKRILA